VAAQLPDKDLILRCQKGDISAFNEIYNQHCTMLFSIAMRMLGTKEDAEDALQNCFIKLHKSIKQYRFQSKFSSYLVRILLNACYDLIGKRKKINEPIENHDFSASNYQDLNLTLETAINILPLKMRACFILYAVEGFKQKEIAGSLKLSEGTVKAHVFQAKVKLRQLLK